MQIQIKKLNPNALIPTRAKQGDAAYDLYALGADRIFPGQRKIIYTGIAVAIPEGYYGRIAPRSGLAVKNGIDVMAGVVDASYRGEIGVVLINLSDDSTDIFEVKPGMRVAQLIIEKCYDAEWVQVDELPESVRGDGGFGSTGTH